MTTPFLQDDPSPSLFQQFGQHPPAPPFNSHTITLPNSPLSASNTPPPTSPTSHSPPTFYQYTYSRHNRPPLATIPPVSAPIPPVSAPTPPVPAFTHPMQTRLQARGQAQQPPSSLHTTTPPKTNISPIPTNLT
jgi:hypothetical protein